MTCPDPLDAAILADYWLGVLPAAEEEAAEEHLFACDSCTARFEDVIAMAEAVRDVARSGSLVMIVSDAFLQRLAEEGLHVRTYAPPKGGTIACTVTPEDDFLIGHLTADLAGATRLDLAFCDERGLERARLQDIPFVPTSGGVSFQQSITYAKAAPSEVLVARLLSIDDAGAELMLGEYTFAHTRTMPGPPAW